MKKRYIPVKPIPISVDYKKKIAEQAYLGKKGYTIPKSIFDEKDLEEVKKDLWLKPFVLGPKPMNGGVVSTFPVYRESVSKLYLPRFYGIDRYGIPTCDELTTSTSVKEISIPFVKELREYQIKIIKVYMDHVSGTKGSENGLKGNNGGGGGGGILEVPCGKGKCLAKGTLVMLYNGGLIPVEEIVVGDLLMGDDGKPRKVLSLARGREEMVTVMEKGSARCYTVNKSHILSLRHFKTGEICDMCIDNYLRRNDRVEWCGWRIPNNKFPVLYDIQLAIQNEDDYYGFEIDGNRRFVLGDYTVTHNTVMALKIISEIKKKTIILVHKEFLMNQWIERMAEFVPSARIGKIQGPVFDIDEKDVVIGMIQTLHSREFPPGSFDSFGLTVIDEVHRIGSEEFSKTLFSVVTPYMLGISATVERKDRLTRLLYMFIGPKIYSEERTDDDVVQVRAVFFKTRDLEFNTTEYDFRGAPKYSTMITKLCQFGPRSDFIVRILCDLLQEHPEKQIMVLAHNRELLSYLYEAIRNRISAEENTVGFYVGGMKEKDLKITEGRRIVLATYAMAAEALDIKTLSTLVMATPKTDIEQSVGRILRAKGQNPIVVDVVDSHEYLRRQYNTRRQFYKKCKYKIVSREMEEYQGFTNVSSWKVEFDPALIAAKTEPRKCLISIPKEELEKEEE